MKARLRTLAACVLALALAGATAAVAQQCPQPTPYNGDEPPEFTHYVDVDEDGACDGMAVPVNETYPNQLYTDCYITPGVKQVPHGHWEYTRRQAEVPGDSEEKDYLDTTLPPDEMDDQALRFATKEPTRFYRALSPTQNPSGNYWQVDEWLGPQGVPLLTWTERFFECSGPTSCGTVDGTPALGGYWSTDAQPLYDAFSQPVVCGDGLSAGGPRSACCGMFFPQFP